ncbi:PhzF family phenazine biosynthesis protein [Mesorhizobium shangrilense]|uniref:PhzF family phenazine biosynthesis protein n=1 Tax=Mesorhizobium shangrilense TaxID=460060 RepID=A0ABV2DLL7_9HYPH
MAAKTFLRQECAMGIVPVEILSGDAGPLFRMTQGVPVYREAGLSRETIARMLGCAETDLAETPPQVVSTGVHRLIVELARFETISALEPDQA